MNHTIWIYTFGVTKFTKKHSKLEIFELASNTQSLTSGALGSDDPTGQREETEEAAFDGAAVVWLADGEDSGDTKATYMIYVMRWFDWCYQLELRPSGGSLSPVMAARQSFSAVY